MKRRGSWQINFIVRALTGMGSIFLVNQWMDYRNIPVSVGLNVLSFYVGVAQNVFFWFKAMDKRKSGAYNTSYKRGKAIS